MKKFLSLLVVIIFVAFGVHYYTYSNISLSKNQKTISEFASKNHFRLQGQVDLSNKFFSEFFISDYQAEFDLNFYNLNSNTAALINFYFDHLSFEYLKIVMFADENFLYWRVLENTLEYGGEYTFLSKNGWQAIDIDNIQANQASSFLSLLKVSSHPERILEWSNEAKSLFLGMNLNVPTLDMNLKTTNVLAWETDFLNLELSSHNFNGILPLSAPTNFNLL